MAQGCVHVKVEKGELTGVFCHLSGLPEDGVAHLKANKVFTREEFLASHQQDAAELAVECAGRFYALGPESIHS